MNEVIFQALKLQPQIKALYNKGIIAIREKDIQVEDSLFKSLAVGKTLVHIEHNEMIHVWYFFNGVKIISVMSPEFFESLSTLEVPEDITNKLRQDLQWQLAFEEIDWDYFIETAQRVKELTETEAKENNEANP